MILLLQRHIFKESAASAGVDFWIAKYKTHTSLLKQPTDITITLSFNVYEVILLIVRHNWVLKIPLFEEQQNNQK